MRPSHDVVDVAAMLNGRAVIALHTSFLADSEYRLLSDKEVDTRREVVEARRVAMSLRIKERYPQAKIKFGVSRGMSGVKDV